MLRNLILLVIALSSLTSGAFAGKRTDLSGIDTGPLRTVFRTLTPTPQGSGYVTLESGESVRIRYALPHTRPISYKLDFHNIRALSGNGTSYLVQLRRDSSTGELLYEGPVCNATFMNAANYEPVEIADRITDADCRRGYLDVFATVYSTDDKWVLYRDEPDGQFSIRCPALLDSPRLRTLAEQNAWMRREGIDLLPMPRSIKPTEHPVTITHGSRIVLAGHPSEQDRFSAELLRQEIKRVSGLDIPIAKDTSSRTGDIVLSCEGKAVANQSYRIRADRVLRAEAPTSTGLFYAAQTIRQLLQPRKDGLHIPGVTIDDSPAVERRMVQYDLAREQTVNMDYMKRMVREMARLKLNQLMLYMEDDFRFTEFPFTGRPGTFTPETARELVEYARRYHVEVVPQLEAMGHGDALLSHPEFADLREDGKTWSFCTTNPRTWEVLEKMLRELAAVFDGTPYLHVGADEFEPTFGKCPACKAEIEKSGWGGLYAMHVNRLNAICRKLGRTMVFWTAHGAWQPELGPDLTIRYADLLDKDCIPMEWVYLGTETYPTVDRLQKAGFERVYAAPTVLGYGTTYPNNAISMSNIGTFARKAATCRMEGLCNTTWELRLGDHFENTWYGHLYCAQACWSGFTPEDECFDESFARHWLGLTRDADAAKIGRLFRLANASGGVASRELFWTRAKELKDQAGVSWPILIERLPEYDRELSRSLSGLDALHTASKSNAETLDSLRQALLMYRLTMRRIRAADEASKLLAQARESGDTVEAASHLYAAAAVLRPLIGDYAEIRKSLCAARDERGGSPQDVKRLDSMSSSISQQITALRGLAASVRVHGTAVIPPSKDLGL